jgi:hypothetical protein
MRLPSGLMTRQPEYEVTMPDGRTFRFHQVCLTIWREERARYFSA